MVDYSTEYKIIDPNDVYTIPINGDKPIKVVFEKCIPPACRNCNNHPSNGGSGFCHCILGLQTFY